ncbi:hypothetical protein CSPAE12_04076 [Colletotrichum incanum]|nr:hypothetical protein CSPAE12_04076 [Colletotrichum incanum]
MKPKVLHRFYEPLVLLKALNTEMNDIADSVDSETVEYRRNSKQAFQAFVYKPAHACDSVKGGKGGTITSVMVLESHSAMDNAVEFWFASNQLTSGELERTLRFITSVLDRLRTATLPQDGSAAARSNLLRLVLLFNQSRIASYLTTIRMEARACFARCLIARDEEDIDDCDVLLRRLIALQASKVGECISRRARQIRESGLQQRSMSCWPEMWHAMNRLLSYAQDVEFFLLAKQEWPELFEDFRVCFVPSSKLILRLRRPKSMVGKGIVGRMTSNEETMQIFQDYIEDLQLNALDERIRAEYQKTTFSPVVHSEILLLDALEKSGHITPDRFFHEWMFIGSSKPLCRLCQYYFKEHRSRVEHRGSHHNLYISWRVPDVLLSQGAKGEERRQIMVDRMTPRIRQDAFDLVRKRVRPTFRDHDSFTSSARMTLDGRWTMTSNFSDVATRMESLALEDTEDNEGGATLGWTGIYKLVNVPLKIRPT